MGFDRIHPGVTRELNNERNDFLVTTFPLADVDRTAPSPAVFPQIADGGGFVIEFILLDAGAGSKTTLSFFANKGRQFEFPQAVRK